MVKSLINNELSWRSPVNRAMWIMLDTGLLYSIFFVRPPFASSRTLEC